MNFPELEEFKTTIEPETRQVHLAEISKRLNQRQVRFGKRRLVIAFVGATLLLPAAAVAAEDSLPGDLLYPIKRALEPMRGLLDEDVAAENRVKELERLVDRAAPLPVVDRQAAEAREAVDRQTRPDLEERIDRALERRSGDGVVPPSPTTTEAVRQEPQTTSTSLPAQPTRPTETTVPDGTTTTSRPPETTTTTIATGDSTRP